MVRLLPEPWVCHDNDAPIAGLAARFSSCLVATAQILDPARRDDPCGRQCLLDGYVDGVNWW